MNKKIEKIIKVNTKELHLLRIIDNSSEGIFYEGHRIATRPEEDMRSSYDSVKDIKGIDIEGEWDSGAHLCDLIELILLRKGIKITRNLVKIEDNEFCDYCEEKDWLFN